MGKISVIVKRPDEKYGHVCNISNTLKNLQKTVGGNIETVTFRDYVIICNEDGKIIGLPYNCSIGPFDLCGTIIVCGADGDEFSDIAIDLPKWKEIINEWN